MQGNNSGTPPENASARCSLCSGSCAWGPGMSVVLNSFFGPSACAAQPKGTGRLRPRPRHMERPSAAHDVGYETHPATTPTVDYGQSPRSDYESTVRTPRSEASSYSYSYTYYSPSERSFKTEREESILSKLASGAGEFFGAVDQSFMWFAERPTEPLVPPPPCPERRWGANPRPDRHAPHLVWLEVGELRSAVLENVQSQKVLSHELRSKDEEAQALARCGEDQLHSKQEQLQQLRERVDHAPVGRARRLEDLHSRLRAASAAVQDARSVVDVDRGQAVAVERAEWLAAEERVARLAAEAARESSVAEAAENAMLHDLSKHVEHLARLEDAMGDAAVVPLAASRRARAALMRDELLERRVSVPRRTHEPPAVLGRRLAALRRGNQLTHRGPSAQGDAHNGIIDHLWLRLSDDRPPRLLLADGTALPLTQCCRIVVGPAERFAPQLLEALRSPPPPRPPNGRAHLCFTLLFRSIETLEAPGGEATEARAPPPLHLVAPNSAVLLDWVLGLQPLCSVWPADRLSAARVRWRSLRVRVVAR